MMLNAKQSAVFSVVLGIFFLEYDYVNATFLYSTTAYHTVYQPT